jgi:hypothetical protein
MSTTNTAGLPSTTGGTLPGYFTDGQQQFFAYNPTGGAVVVADQDHWRISPQAYYYYGPFGLLGEYAISDQAVRRTGVAPFSSAHLENTAWDVSASWVLTGEDATFAGGVIPRHPFNPAQGDWGALQLVGRYAELSIDSAAFPLFSDPTTSARSAAAWSAGLNWYLNRNVMVKLELLPHGLHRRRRCGNFRAGNGDPQAGERAVHSRPIGVLNRNGTRDGKSPVRRCILQSKGSMFKRGMKALLRGLAVLAVSTGWAAGKEITLLNVSYDPTRELYQDYNSAFARHWLEKTGDKVTIRQSHAVRGSRRVR